MHQGSAGAGLWSNRTAITSAVEKIEKKKHNNNAWYEATSPKMVHEKYDVFQCHGQLQVGERQYFQLGRVLVSGFSSQTRSLRSSGFTRSRSTAELLLTQKTKLP